MVVSLADVAVLRHGLAVAVQRSDFLRETAVGPAARGVLVAAQRPAILRVARDGVDRGHRFRGLAHREAGARLADAGRDRREVGETHVGEAARLLRQRLRLRCAHQRARELRRIRDRDVREALRAARERRGRGADRDVIGRGRDRDARRRAGHAHARGIDVGRKTKREHDLAREVVIRDGPRNVAVDDLIDVPRRRFRAGQCLCGRNFREVEDIEVGEVGARFYEWSAPAAHDHRALRTGRAARSTRHPGHGTRPNERLVETFPRTVLARQCVTWACVGKWRSRSTTSVLLCACASRPPRSPPRSSCWRGTAPAPSRRRRSRCSSPARWSFATAPRAACRRLAPSRAASLDVVMATAIVFALPLDAPSWILYGFADRERRAVARSARRVRRDRRVDPRLRHQPDRPHRRGSGHVALGRPGARSRSGSSAPSSCTAPCARPRTASGCAATAMRCARSRRRGAARRCSTSCARRSSPSARSTCGSGATRQALKESLAGKHGFVERLPTRDPRYIAVILPAGPRRRRRSSRPSRATSSPISRRSSHRTSAPSTPSVCATPRRTRSTRWPRRRARRPRPGRSPR